MLAYLHSPRTGDYEWSDAGETLTAPLAARVTSNFDGPGIAPAGQFGGMSWSGAFDIAGDAKEWIFNEASQEKRFILGGAWNEPSYMFFDADARSPFERSANFGFRCAKYQLTGEATKTADPIKVAVPDDNSMTPLVHAESAAGRHSGEVGISKPAGER